jgi:hypothetical protein
VVVGQEDPAIDVDAVQTAVDRGGSVHLLGTFDFGDDGRVLLHRDVAISCGADALGRPITTITGGDWPFCAPAPADVPPAQTGPVISIECIHFREPAGGAIHLDYAGGACIRGNEVTALRRRPSITFFRCAGRLIGAHDALVTITSIRSLITGSIVVIENEIHLADLHPPMTPGKGGSFIRPMGPPPMWPAIGSRMARAAASTWVSLAELLRERFGADLGVFSTKGDLRCR